MKYYLNRNGVLEKDLSEAYVNMMLSLNLMKVLSCHPSPAPNIPGVTVLKYTEAPITFADLHSSWQKSAL